MSRVIFQNRREIHQWIRDKLSSVLNQNQRDSLEEALSGLLDAGEVTRAEVDLTLTKELRQLRDAHIFSSYEYAAIISALKER